MKLKAKQLDQFYSADHVVIQFLNLIKTMQIVQPNSILIEPSAGDGNLALHFCLLK